MNWRRQTKFLSGEKVESNLLEIVETDVEYSGRGHAIETADRS
jgi:hypothetical protein